MGYCRLAALWASLLILLAASDAGANTRCRLTHFAAGESDTLALDIAMAVKAVEARAAFKGDNPNGPLSKNRWGIAFDNGLKIDICRGNTDFGTEYNRQQLVVSAYMGDTLLKTSTLHNGLSAKASDYHTLKVSFDDGIMEVSAGNNELLPVLSMAVPTDLPKPRGVKAVKTGKGWTPAYLWVEEDTERSVDVCPYDAENLARVGSGIGGLWKMFDRENDTRYALPGGDYTLACIPDPDSPGDYLLLMHAGAQKCREAWPQGAVKGRMKPTPFKMQYTLTWTAANGSTLDDEAYAILRDDQQLLTLVFPLNRATLRFARQRSAF